MALYAISDLHLPLGIDKPMDIFGKQWENYVQRLRENWQNTVKPEDLVILPGDLSWATYLEQSLADFQYLEELNGRKIILKGNHDYWWTTMKKMNTFLEDNGIKSVEFLQNNAAFYKDIALCGTRGWIFGDQLGAEDQKIYDRELIRLELSLKEAQKRGPREIFVFLHYPPTNKKGIPTDMTRLIERYGAKKCVYGHLHASSQKNAVNGVVNGVEYQLVSGDFVEFQPVLLAGDRNNGEEA